MQELDINKWHLSSQRNQNGYTVTKKMENCSRCEDQVTVCTVCTWRKDFCSNKFSEYLRGSYERFIVLKMKNTKSLP